MDNHDIDADPGSQPGREEPGSSPRARWRARRSRKRLAKQWRDPDILRKQRRRTWLKAGAALLVPAAVIAAVAYWPEISGPAEREAVNRTPPSTTPTNYIPDATVQLDRPFVGTPAAEWQDGLSGVRFPKPKAVGDFSAKEVAKALKGVRKALRAAYLDPQVIADHEIDRYLHALAPGAREHIAEEPAAWVVQIHPDYSLLPASPKANGKVSVRAGEPGELIIEARFAIAYAFDTDQPSELRDALDIVAVMNARDTYRYYTGPTWNSANHGVNPNESEGFAYSINCDAWDNDYRLAPAYSDPRYTLDTDAESLTPEAQFDPDAPITAERNCPSK